jgi:predicted dehydrogenase
VVRRTVDLDETAAAQLAEDLAAGDWTVNPSEAFLRDDVDAVVIATPHDTHVELVADAARAGKHVFATKPLALRYPDAQRVGEVVAESGVVGCVGFAFRAAPAVQTARQHIPRPLAITLHAVVDPLAEGWPGEASQGGVLAHVGSHAIDLACHLAASPPVRVHALGGRYARRAGLPDTYAATLRFASQAVAQLIVGEFGRSSRFSSWWGTVSDGTREASLWNDLRSVRVMAEGQSVASVLDGPPETANHARLLGSFVQAVRAGKSAPASIEDGVRAVRVADAIYESIATKQPVDL